MGERIEETYSEIGVSYAYFDGTTHKVDGEEQEVENVVFLDGEFNELLCVAKNAVVDAKLMEYRLKGLTVKCTPIPSSDPKNISLESAIWLKSSEKEINKYRLLLVKQEASKVFAQARRELKGFNPKKGLNYKFF